jgi:hypothetical protein
MDPLVAGSPVQATGNVRSAIRIVVPKAGVGVGAADGQQPVFVTTGAHGQRPWRIMIARSAIEGH